MPAKFQYYLYIFHLDNNKCHIIVFIYTVNIIIKSHINTTMMYWQKYFIKKANTYKMFLPWVHLSYLSFYNISTAGNTTQLFQELWWTLAGCQESWLQCHQRRCQSLSYLALVASQHQDCQTNYFWIALFWPSNPLQSGKHIIDLLVDIIEYSLLK